MGAVYKHDWLLRPRCKRTTMLAARMYDEAAAPIEGAFVSLSLHINRLFF